MAISNMFDMNNLLATGLNASVLRNEVIQNNIANVDTPGYKKKTVSFEESLINELNSYSVDGEVDLNNVSAKINNTGFSYRLDDNNVDMEEEMVNLYQNSVKYDTLASGVMSNYNRINSVLNG